MAIVRQKTQQQQRREGWMIVAGILVLAIATATGLLDAILLSF